MTSRLGTGMSETFFYGVGRQFGRFISDSRHKVQRFQMYMYSWVRHKSTRQKCELHNWVRQQVFAAQPDALTTGCGTSLRGKTAKVCAAQLGAPTGVCGTTWCVLQLAASTSGCAFNWLRPHATGCGYNWVRLQPGALTTGCAFYCLR